MKISRKARWKVFDIYSGRRTTAKQENTIDVDDQKVYLTVDEDYELPGIDLEIRQMIMAEIGIDDNTKDCPRTILTDNLKKRIDEMISDVSDETIVIKCGNVMVNKEDVINLIRSGLYIPDTIVNAFSNQIIAQYYKMFKSFGATPNHRAAEWDLRILNTFALNLIRKYPLDKARKLLKLDDEKSVGSNKKQLILMPVHIAACKHWILLVVRRDKRQILVYDSMQSLKHSYLQTDVQTIARFFESIQNLDDCCRNNDGSWFQVKFVPCVQQAPGSNDCGVHLCLNMEQVLTSYRLIDSTFDKSLVKLKQNGREYVKWRLFSIG